MTIEELKSKLTEKLLAMLPKNMAQDVTREDAMANLAEALAEPIDEAVLDVQSYDWKGMASVAEICTMQSPQRGDVWGVTDGGTIVWPGAEPMEVTKGDIVVYNGSGWKMFLHIDTAVVDCYTKAETDERIDTAVNAEANARQTADNALSAAITAEATARANADTALGERIDSEASARESADNTLQGNIDAEASARESADDALDARIDSEETSREDGDRDLQAQIDAISSRSDVVNIVANYVELLAYDTSTLADNDVIKVLADETHEDAIAYYCWGAVSEAWSFIGSQGPYYTISETDTLLAGRAPTNHASTATTYGVGDATHFGHVKVDSALSSTSTNPVQNKAVKAALDGKVADADVVHKIGDEIIYNYKAFNDAYGTRKKAYNVANLNFSDGSFALEFVIYTKLKWSAIASARMPVVSLDGASYGDQQPSHIDYFMYVFKDSTHPTGYFFLKTALSYGAFKPQSFYFSYIGDDGEKYVAIGMKPEGQRFYFLGFSVSLSFPMAGDVYGTSYANGWTVGIRHCTVQNVPIDAPLIPDVGVDDCVEVIWKEIHSDISGNAASATHLRTPRNLKVNLASESAQSFDGSANAESIGVSGALQITHGGTGKTNANDAANALINGLPLWSADVTDNTQIIRQDNAGAATFGRVPGSAMWNYIKGKVKSWLGVDSSDKIADSHIASASTWNGKANANGSNATGTWDVAITKNAATATNALSLSYGKTRLTTGYWHKLATLTSSTDDSYDYVGGKFFVYIGDSYTNQNALQVNESGMLDVVTRRNFTEVLPFSTWGKKNVYYSFDGNADIAFGIVPRIANNRICIDIYCKYSGNSTQAKTVSLVCVDSYTNQTSGKPIITFVQNDAGSASVSNIQQSTHRYMFYADNATNAEHASTADKATEVVDYGGTAYTIKIGYRGNALSSATSLAAYTVVNGQNCIKDINVDNVTVGTAKKLQVNSAVGGPLRPCYIAGNGVPAACDVEFAFYD